MDKFGRKQSKDPKQESLRTEKESWNEETSELIDELIALKRSLNGRADSKHNLPASSIKESFPTEVSSYLNHVTDSAAKVINRARGIINQQDNYSKTRRRHKKKEAQEALELLKEASWWGSRFYAKNISLRKLPARQKNTIIEIINSLVDLEEKLKFFRENILKSGKSGIYPGIQTLNSVITFYVRNVLLKFKDLEDFLKEVPAESPPGSSPGSSPGSDVESEPGTDTGIERPKDPNSPSGGAPSLPLTGTPPRDLTDRQASEQENLSALTRVKEHILADLDNVRLCQKFIENNHPLFFADQSLKEEFLSACARFFSNTEYILKIKGATPQGPSDRLSKLQKFKDSYREVVKSFLKFMFKGEVENGTWEDLGGDNHIQIKKILELTGQGWQGKAMPGIGTFTIADIFDVLPVDEINKFKGGKTENKSDGKEKGGKSKGGKKNDKKDDQSADYSLVSEASIRTYLKEKVLSLSSDNFSILQLAVNNLTKQCIEQLDRTLNTLERADTGVVGVKDSLQNLTKILVLLLDNSIDLAEGYRRHIRLSRSSLAAKLPDLKSEDISSLHYQRKALKQFI